MSKKGRFWTDFGLPFGSILGPKSRPKTNQKKGPKKGGPASAGKSRGALSNGGLGPLNHYISGLQTVSMDILSLPSCRKGTVADIDRYRYRYVVSGRVGW